jgi:acetylornithine deacetylase
VPDRLEFEGRAPVRVGEDVGVARAAVEAAIVAACEDASVVWSGGQFASGETPVDDPLARVVLDAVGDGARFAGVPWGADMRLWCAAGVPTVMVGTSGIQLAHAVDERVRVDELGRLGEVLVRVARGFAAA